MSKQLLFLFLSVFYCTLASGQELCNEVFPIEGIEINKSWDDLSFLEEELKDKRVVMLGEAHHGDGTTIELKARIIAYLHQKLGFEVVAFESDFFSLLAYSDSLKNDRADFSSIEGNVHKIWRRSKQFEATLNYLKDHPDLTVAGFDCAGNSRFLRESLEKELDRCLPGETATDNYKKLQTLALAYEEEGIDVKVKRKDKEFIYDYLQELEDRIKPKSELWAQIIPNYIGDWKSALEYRKSLKGGLNNNIRDTYMADNLLYLLQERYPDKKVIVWAANIHVAKNPEAVTENRHFNSDEIILMGDLVADAMPGESAHLAFISYGGEYAWPLDKTAHPIPEPPANALESRIKACGYPFAYYALSNMNSSEPYPSKMMVHFPWDGRWHEVFDGVFYIEEMKRSDRREY
jgi:erythromycin esterase-like protein